MWARKYGKLSGTLPRDNDQHSRGWCGGTAVTQEWCPRLPRWHNSHKTWPNGASEESVDNQNNNIGWAITWILDNKYQQHTTPTHTWLGRGLALFEMMPLRNTSTMSIVMTWAFWWIEVAITCLYYCSMNKTASLLSWLGQVHLRYNQNKSNFF